MKFTLIQKTSTPGKQNKGFSGLDHFPLIENLYMSEDESLISRYRWLDAKWEYKSFCKDTKKECFMFVSRISPNNMTIERFNLELLSAHGNTNV